jgi:hypothetical protein
LLVGHQCAQARKSISSRCAAAKACTSAEPGSRVRSMTLCLLIDGDTH